jgi:hypothetical protein
MSYAIPAKAFLGDVWLKEGFDDPAIGGDHLQTAHLGTDGTHKMREVAENMGEQHILCDEAECAK